MTFWLEKEWQTRASDAVEVALNGVHGNLHDKNLGNGAWTAETLRSFVGVARNLCVGNVVCGLKFAPDDTCTGEWLYDFACWLEGPEGRGFVGLPLIAESEWGKWDDIWDDFDKLLQARTGLRVLVFCFHKNNTPADWHAVLSRRARNFAQGSADDAWLFACWHTTGFEFRSGLIE